MLDPRNHAAALLARAIPYIRAELSEFVLDFLLSGSTHRIPLQGWSRRNAIEQFVIYTLEDIRDENPHNLNEVLEYLTELLDEKESLSRKANGQGAVHDPAPPP